VLAVDMVKNITEVIDYFMKCLVATSLLKCCALVTGPMTRRLTNTILLHAVVSTGKTRELY